jgi:NAD(P)H dehydrogenase (quinone)
MKVSVILAHPKPESFNHAIAWACCEQLHADRHDVRCHDLYVERFEPMLPYEEFEDNVPLPAIIADHCREIAEADGIIIVHPNWWGQPPAVLKGWIDRVLRPGVAYRFLDGDSGEGVPQGLLKAKAVIVFNTSNTSAQREENVFLDPLETIWKNCIFDLCGVTNFYRKMFRIVITSTREQRQTWLDEVKQTVNHYFPRPG